jgi:hypothetical protein
MKVRLPKSYNDLPRREKEIIAQVKENEINEHFAQLQKNWLMLSCMVLHNNFGFGKDRCLLYLANWREMYRVNANVGGNDKQEAWLKSEMDKIFGKDGYPYEYIDKLEDVGK